MADVGSFGAKKLALDEISRDPILAPMLEYWETHHREREIPRPQDIDPTLLPHAALPHLTVVDVIDGGARFRFRLVGTAIVAEIGIELSGHYLDEMVAGELLTATLERYRAAIGHRRPIYCYAEYIFHDKPSVKNRLIILPLSSDGQTIDRLLIPFSADSQWLARQAIRNQETDLYHPYRLLVPL